MGTFGVYIGNKDIPDDKREIFSKQMERILNLGGMMELDKISLYDTEIALLEPFKVTPGEKTYFSYNYFEDNSWETAEYDDKTGLLWTEKIGSAEFCYVAAAAYLLYSLYDESGGIVRVNEDIVGQSDFIGWINNILGTSFSMKNRSNIWGCMENLAKKRLEFRDVDVIKFEDIYSLIPSEKAYASGGRDITDLLYIINGTDSLSEEEVEAESYPGDVLRCRRIIEKLFEDDRYDNTNLILDLIKKPFEERKKEYNPMLKPLAEVSLFMPARVIIYLTAEIIKREFWSLWVEIKDKAYLDEVSKEYASEKLISYRKTIWEKPVPPVMTSRFLRYNDFLYHHNDPKEVKKLPDYFVSDADRLYWWDGSDEVKITEETDKWIRTLAERHRELVEKSSSCKTEIGCLKELIMLLDEICTYYRRIYAFKNMFYDFIEHSSRREYIAAVELLKEIANSEENRKTGEMIKYASIYYWETSNRKVTFNQAHLQIKRYLSIMANPMLREKYFGF